jgi:hypothetical protein
MDLPESNPAGYQWLAEKFGAAAMPHWKKTRILVRGARRLVESDGRQMEYLPAAQDPGNGVFDQLEFALRKEGLHLELLRKVMVRPRYLHAPSATFTPRKARAATKSKGRLRTNNGLKNSSLFWSRHG